MAPTYPICASCENRRRASRQAGTLYTRAWRPPAEAATQLQRYSEVSLVFPSIFRSMIRKYCDSRRRAVINITKIRKLLTYLIFFRTGQPQINSICANCRTSQFRAQLFRARPYSAAAVTDAATQAEAHHLKPTESDPHPPITVSPKDEYRIKGGIILTRAPLITRALTPFENAFFFYQKRLNERLVLPFRHTLFYKKDTATDLDWRIKFEERGRIAAKELGRYYSKGRNAWNDELLVGSTLSNEDRVRDILLKDAELRVTEDGEPAKPDEIVPVERPMSRITEADKTNDIRRLDRKLDRTLYLVVQTEYGKWQFPAGDATTEEALHEVCLSLSPQPLRHLAAPISHTQTLSPDLKILFSCMYANYSGN